MKADRPAGGPTTLRRVLLVLGSLVGLLLLAYAVAWFAVGDGVPRGTTVLGVDVGGQSRAEAARTLEAELSGPAAQPVAVRAGAAETEVDPAQAGLVLDVPATADAAQGRSWNPLELVDALIGGDEVTPVVAVDEGALEAAVAQVADSLDQPPVEGDVSYSDDGAVETVTPRQGVRIHQARAADALAAGYLSALPPRPVELPARVVQPEIGAAEVDRVVAQVARPAVAAPVPLTVEGTTVEVPPRAIARSLEFEPDGQGSLAPTFDVEALHAAAAKRLRPVEKPARDATFRIVGGRPQVVPSRTGLGVSPDQLAAVLLPVLGETGPARAATATLEVSEPELDTAAAEALGVVEQVSTFTTYYPSDFAPRLTNIHRAADLMDDTLVLPGKVFSLNRTVGERTAERGFAAGFIINNGRIEVDYGGGVSQLATTMFNAAFFAGLEVLEHHPHSFYISRYPEGRESTVAWGVKDVRVRNDSPHGIFVTTSYTNSSVTVSMYGTKRYRIEAVKGPRYDYRPYQVEYDPRPEGRLQGDCVSTEGVSGFRVVVTRQFYQGGRLVKEEDFRTLYNPENEVRCGSSGPPDPEPEPEPTGT